MRPGVHVFLDKRDLDQGNRQVIGKSYGKIIYQIYKILCCNRDILSVAPWDVRKDIRLRLNSIRTLRTTNIQAFAGDCTRAETRMHLPFYKDLEANVCTRLLVVHAPLDGKAVVLEVESFEAKGSCGVTDSVAAQGDIRQE
jgi:hypothetical protein